MKRLLLYLLFSVMFIMQLNKKTTRTLAKFYIDLNFASVLVWMSISNTLIVGYILQYHITQHYMYVIIY